MAPAAAARARLTSSTVPAVTVAAVPEGDTIHRAAKPPPGAGRPAHRRGVAASACPRRARRRADRRARARVGRGARQEPALPLRRAASCCARICACPAAGRVAPAGGRRDRQAVARPAGRAGRRRCSGTGRCSSCTRGRSPGSARTSSSGRPGSTRCSRGCAPPTRRAGSARRCSTSRSSPGSGTCGSPRRCGASELSPWRRLRDVPEADRRRALEAAAELMRASVDGARRGGHQVYRRVGRPCPRCGARDPVVGPGRRQPHDLLVSRLPGRRRPAARVTPATWRFAPRISTSRCARSASRRSRPSAARRSRSRSRSMRPGKGRRSTSTGRSFAASSRSRRRRCGGCPDARNAIDDLKREPAAAIFARAHSGHRRHRRRGALPLDSRPDAHLDGRAERRVRLARRRVRRRVRRSRADALRQRAHLRRARAGDRALGRERRRPRRRHHAAPDRVGRDLASLARGAGPDAARVRARHRPAAPAGAEARARARRVGAARMRPRSSPTRSPRCGSRPPARSRPARSSSSGSTSGRCASRRCCRSRRRSRAARRRGSTRCARGWPPTCASS